MSLSTKCWDPLLQKRVDEREQSWMLKTKAIPGWRRRPRGQEKQNLRRRRGGEEKKEEEEEEQDEQEDEVEEKEE